MLCFVTDAKFILVFVVTHLELQVDIQARELYLEFSNWILTHMRDIWIFVTGVLHRNSSRIYLAEWFGLVNHFGKMCLWLYLKNQMYLLGKQQKRFQPKMFSEVQKFTMKTQIFGL